MTQLSKVKQDIHQIKINQAT